jgi:hypothetical protein
LIGFTNLLEVFCLAGAQWRCFVRKTLIAAFAVALLLLVLPGCLPKLPKDLQAAIEIVKGILPDEIPQGSEYICSFYSKELTSGSKIDLENPGSIVDGNIDGVAATDNTITVNEPSYLFLLDLDPGSFFAHPVKAIVVGVSGQYRVISGKWLPRVDEVVPEELKLPIPPKERLVDWNVFLKEPSGKMQNLVFDRITPDWGEREAIIVVQGLLPSESLYTDSISTYTVFLNLALAYKDAMPEGRVEVQGIFGEGAADILTSINSYAAKKEIVTVYIIAHGDTDAIRLGGVWHYAWQFRTVFSSYPLTQFNFLLGSCHSGSFIDDLNTLENIRTVLTACREQEGATRDMDQRYSLVSPYELMNDFNPSDVGSEWTSSIVDGAVSILKDPTQFNLVRADSVIYDVPVISMLLKKAHMAALGNWAPYYSENLDLSNRIGKSVPLKYCSWE